MDPRQYPDQYVPPQDASLIQALAGSGSPAMYAYPPQALNAAGVQQGPAPYSSDILNAIAMLAQWMGMAMPGRGGMGAPMPDSAGLQGLVALLRRYLPAMADAGGSRPADAALLQRGVVRARGGAIHPNTPSGAEVGYSATSLPRRVFPEVQSMSGGEGAGFHPQATPAGPIGLPAGPVPPDSLEQGLPRLIEIMERFYGPGRRGQLGVGN